MTLSQRFELSITNDISELRRLAEWLSDITHRLAIPRDIAFRLDLCLHEAVHNVIQHAHRERRPHPIDVCLLLESDALRLEIEDEGAPFDPLNVTPITPASDLTEAKAGGWGISLIRQFSDQCQYDRRECKNRLILLFRRDRGNDVGAEPPR